MHPSDGEGNFWVKFSSAGYGINGDRICILVFSAKSNFCVFPFINLGVAVKQTAKERTGATMKRKTSLKSNSVLNLCLAALLGLGITFAVSLVGAWLGMKSDDPISGARTVALIALGCGGFLSSFFAGKKGKSFVLGLFGGGCFLLTMLFVSLFGGVSEGGDRIVAFGAVVLSVLVGAFLSSKKGNESKRRLRKLGIKQ